MEKTKEAIYGHNSKVFPLYRSLSVDFLFFYTINFLFLTQVKHFLHQQLFWKIHFMLFFQSYFNFHQLL